MKEQQLVPRPYVRALSRAPKGINAGQFTANIKEEAVVFLVGMRINRVRRFWSWLPALAAMPPMLRQLARSPGSGFLGARIYWSGRVFLVLQYWRSAEDLGVFARNSDFSHVHAWRAFNQKAAGTGDVGVFHETYTIPASRIESLYGNMPSFGLGAAHGLAPRHRSPRSQATQRMKVSEPEYVPAEI